MPNISTKELTALEDQLGQEQILIKKYQAFANQCTDAMLKGKCQDIASKHQQHYNTLMNYLS